MRWSVGALVLLVAAVGATVALGAGSSFNEKSAFSVSSTLHGRSLLPHRVRWIATPSLPSSSIREVDFLIDGRVAWVEQKSPYVYGEDDGAHRGYLVTSWLRRGRHTFTVKAIAQDGRTAITTTKASVVKRTRPPAALSGTWVRTIADTSAAPAAGSVGNPTDTYTPPGTYRMVVDDRYLQVRFPGRFQRPQSDNTGNGWILDSDYVPGPNSFKVFGPVAFAPFTDQAEGGQWCYVDGPAATYEWTASGHQLTLTPVGSDRCGIRAFVLAGTWTRAS